MDFSAWLKKIKQASMLLDLLNKDVEEATKPKPAMYRRIPFFVDVETSFDWLDYTQKERTWFNGAEDVYIQGVAVRTSQFVSSTFQSIWMPPVDSGFSTSSTSPRRSYFDFGWNFRTSRTGALYLTPSNASALLASTTLRKQRRDNFLYFEHPKQVKAGDVLVTQVKPFRYTQNQTLSTSSFIVCLTFFGYRNGALHVRNG